MLLLLFNTITVSNTKESSYTTSLHSSLDSSTISTTQSPTTSVSATSSGTVPTASGTVSTVSGAIPIVLGVIGGTMLLIIILLIIVIAIIILTKNKSEHLICLNNVLLSIIHTDNCKRPAMKSKYNNYYYTCTCSARTIQVLMIIFWN